MPERSNYSDVALEPGRYTLKTNRPVSVDRIDEGLTPVAIDEDFVHQGQGYGSFIVTEAGWYRLTIYPRG